MVSINGIETTGGKTAFKRQDDKVSGIFASSPEYFSKPGMFQTWVKFLHFMAIFTILVAISLNEGQNVDQMFVLCVDVRSMQCSRTNFGLKPEK